MCPLFDRLGLGGLLGLWFLSSLRLAFFSVGQEEVCFENALFRDPRSGGVLREQLGQLFERYPGLRLLTMDALYAERDLCQAIVSHGRDYLVRIKGNQPEVLAALADGFAVEELGEPEAETVEKKRV